jgi:hypothetical protein
MSQENSYGLLLDAKNLKLQRSYFLEMVRLLGIYVIYRAPRKDKHWTNYQEIESNYENPLLIGCIFHEHPDQRSLKKLGWMTELQENESVISVGYDTPNLQVGSLIIVPSGIDNTQGRLFRITRLENTMIYPESISCTCVPEYETDFSSTLTDHKNNSLNLLVEEQDNL